MEKVQVWILAGLVLVMTGIIGWATNTWFSGLNKRLEQMIDLLNQLNNNIIRHEQLLETMHQQMTDHENRLRDLEKFRNNHN